MKGNASETNGLCVWMKLLKNTLKCFMKRDGSVGQSACIKAWRHKFDPQNTHKVEGENGLPALSLDLPSTSEERGQRDLMTSFTGSPFWKSVTLCDYSHPFCSPVFPEPRLNSAHQSMGFPSSYNSSLPYWWLLLPFLLTHRPSPTLLQALP